MEGVSWLHLMASHVCAGVSSIASAPAKSRSSKPAARRASCAGGTTSSAIATARPGCAPSPTPRVHLGGSCHLGRRDVSHAISTPTEGERSIGNAPALARTVPRASAAAVCAMSCARSGRRVAKDPAHRSRRGRGRALRRHAGYPSSARVRPHVPGPAHRAPPPAAARARRERLVERLQGTAGTTTAPCSAPASTSPPRTSTRTSKPGCVTTTSSVRTATTPSQGRTPPRSSARIDRAYSVTRMTTPKEIQIQVRAV